MLKRIATCSVVGALALVTTGLVGVQEASACASGSCKDMENVTCYTTAGEAIIIQDDACELGGPGC